MLRDLNKIEAEGAHGYLRGDTVVLLHAKRGFNIRDLFCVMLDLVLGRKSIRSDSTKSEEYVDGDQSLMLVTEYVIIEVDLLGRVRGLKCLGLPCLHAKVLCPRLQLLQQALNFFDLLAVCVLE